MTEKLDLFWISARNKISNFLEDFRSEETGAAEIVAIILIIVAVIAAAALFKDKIEKLIEDVFAKISI